MAQSFVGWLRQQMSATSRADREMRAGTVLLFFVFIWIFTPFVFIVRIVAQVLQLLLGIYLSLHGVYLKSLESAEEARRGEVYRRRRYEEGLKQLREMTIKRIAEADGISLEEAAKKADETEWLDEEGNVLPPPWMRETEEASC